MPNTDTVEDGNYPSAEYISNRELILEMRADIKELKAVMPTFVSVRLFAGVLSTLTIIVLGVLNLVVA